MEQLLKQTKMKTEKLMRSLLIIIFMLGVVACHSGKKITKVEQQEKIILPFAGSDYRTNEKYLRFVQSHESVDLSNAKSRALMKAQAGIAQTASVLVKSVMHNYLNERKIDEQSEYGDKYNAITQLVLKEKLNNTRIIGEEVYRDKATGKYTYYIALEMNADELLEKSINGISGNARMHQDFEEERFRKIFNDEMTKFDTEHLQTENK